MTKTPNPGSDEAIDAGCTCPVLDNAHGKGYKGIEGRFVYNLECPIHCGDDNDQ
jgi:hypothetical protein